MVLLRLLSKLKLKRLVPNLNISLKFDKDRVIHEKSLVLLFCTSSRLSIYSKILNADSSSGLY